MATKALAAIHRSGNALMVNKLNRPLVKRWIKSTHVPFGDLQKWRNVKWGDSRSGIQGRICRVVIFNLEQSAYLCFRLFSREKIMSGPRPPLNKTALWMGRCVWMWWWEDGLKVGLFQPALCCSSFPIFQLLLARWTWTPSSLQVSKNHVNA